ncbi:MAG TPA: hypothetical protein VIP11_10910 [Gemmatimonadaceae bacterium]
MPTPIPILDTIVVHADISGDRTDRFMSAACYVARASELGTAVEQWNALLLEAGVTHFHATDFFAFQKQFKGWHQTRDRHADFERRFAAIAANAGLLGCATVVDNVAFGQDLMHLLDAEDRTHPSNDPRIMSLMRCLVQAANMLDRVRAPAQQMGSVLVFVEEEHGFGRYVTSFDESKKRGEKWTRWFRRIAPASKLIAPVQMADLLAYECWRRVADLEANRNAPMRPAFKLLTTGAYDIQVINEHETSVNATLFRRILRDHPSVDTQNRPLMDT